MSWEKNIWEWRVIYRGLWDVIWIGGGRPTVRVSLGQSPPWPHTKKHFYNCQLMTAAENKNNRNCKSLVFSARWLVIKKNLARDKKVIDCAGSRETKHGKALSWPCFAATAKKTGKRTMITKATRDCTYWNFILCFICHLGFALRSTGMEHNSLFRRKSLI